MKNRILFVLNITTLFTLSSIIQVSATEGGRKQTYQIKPDAILTANINLLVEQLRVLNQLMAKSPSIFTENNRNEINGIITKLQNPQTNVDIDFYTMAET